jgi:phosphoketolase
MSTTESFQMLLKLFELFKSALKVNLTLRQAILMSYEKNILQIATMIKEKTKFRKQFSEISNTKDTTLEDVINTFTNCCNNKESETNQEIQLLTV